jgi:signal transduction histidine kinase
LFIPARWRYLWLFFVVLVCALVFRLAFVDRLNELKQPYEIRQGALIDQAALLINTRLSLVETQIRLFRHELELLNPTQAELEPAMIAMFKLYSDTLQVRWIDEQGFEQVRLNKTADNNVGVVLTDELQNKRNRYYVEAGLALADDEVFISRIDLNVEQGKVERPFQPTLRGVIKASLASMGNGLLVINFDLRSLLNEVAALSETNIQLLVAAGEDRWIVHPDKSQLWRSDLNLEATGIETDLPKLVKLIEDDGLAQGAEDNNQLYTAQRIASPYQSESSLQDIVVITQTTPSVLSSLKDQALLRAALLAIATGIAGVILLTLYSRHLREVNELSVKLEQERDNLKTTLERQSSLINELAETKKLSSLSIMVAGLAHELNTPVGATQLALSSQASLLDNLIENKNTGLTKSAFDNYLEQSGKSLQQAQINNQRAIELIQSFKRLTFERANNELNTFNVAQHLDDLCQSMHGMLRKQNIRLDSKLPNHITLTGYAGAFSQIVQIIISNAIDHAFENMAGACLKLSCEYRGRDVVVIIRDNGKGIKADELPHIFEPFVTSKRQEEHTGLGLHMARVWIEQAFSGDIKVESSPGVGTTFELTFRSAGKLAERIAKDRIPENPFT